MSDIDIDVTYIFEVSPSMNSKWAIFWMCHYCIQWAIWTP